ncbi:myogenesis-regulating glycosidase [Nilaparvata lugens]|uniref:myogenesis-regulating glycosidase n=1 Tax=Nilaparvata lugens TaxID=108931 RepID=UPI00193C8A23|nr:myogenesis-regulating glycosidase [Nilaparvata lugens]
MNIGELLSYKMTTAADKQENDSSQEPAPECTGRSPMQHDFGQHLIPGYNLIFIKEEAHEIHCIQQSKYVNYSNLITGSYNLNFIKEKTQSVSSNMDRPKLIKVIGCVFVLLTIASLFMVFADNDLSSEKVLSEDNETLRRAFVGYLEDEKLVHLEVLSTLEGKPPKLTGKLGVNLHQDDVDDVPSPNVSFQPQTTVFTWDSLGIRLQISRQSDTDRCHVIRWTSTHARPLEDCFLIGAASWYGGPEHLNQRWPIEKLQLKELAYVPSQPNNVGKTEPFWFNSDGISIYVNVSTPLFVDVRNHRSDGLCLIADDRKPYLPRAEKLLQYTLCNFEDARQAYEYSVANLFDRPAALPDRRMVQHPVWSTWVRYKKLVNQSVVLQFARDIAIHGFNNSQMEIDDNWESCYGETAFNISRFPDMKLLTKQLKDMGFRTTIWTHPFVNKECPDFALLKDKGYFVANQTGEVLMKWWDGEGGVVDFTKPSAVQWFAAKHTKLLQDYAIDGFKFDAGEVGWLPQIARLNCSLDQHPRCFSQSYAETLAKFGPMSEMRVSFRTQRHAMYTRMLDKDSKWSWDNGLRTLITTMFVQNMNGYPFVLPDMVGGNAYAGDKIEKELFIRWLQANCFMPSIQFSAAPWDFDDQTVAISKKLTALHYSYSEVIVQLMQRSVETGAPLNPPIWWVDPQDAVAQKINDEYLLGEDILVAPVLKKGATKRNIYLPKGYWREENPPHRLFKGRSWLRNYPVGLDILPYFTRVQGNTLSPQEKRDIHLPAEYQLIVV